MIVIEPKCIEHCLYNAVTEDERDDIASVISSYLLSTGKDKKEVTKEIMEWYKEIQGSEIKHVLAAAIVLEAMEDKPPFSCEMVGNINTMRESCPYTNKDQCPFYSRTHIVQVIKNRIYKVHFVISDNAFFRIYLKNTDRVIEIKDKNIIGFKSFQVEWLKTFSELIELRRSEWRELRQHIIDISEKIDETDFSISQQIRDAFIYYLQSCRITNNYKDLITSSFVILHDEYHHTIEVLSKDIKDFLVNNHFDISMRKLRTYFSKWLVGRTKTVRIMNKTYRVWIFNEHSLEEDGFFVNPPEFYEEEEEEEE